MKGVHISDVKYVLPADRVIAKLLDYQSVGSDQSWEQNLKYLPNPKWESPVRINTNFSAVTSKVNSATGVTNQAINTSIVSTTLAYELHPSTG